MAGAALVGAGIQIYGDIKSADDQASLDRSRAQIAMEQTGEIQEREVANESLRNQQATRQKLQFGASYAASGKAGIGVGSLLQIQNQTDIANMMSNREAQFQQKMLQQQAGIDTTLASETEQAGTLNAIGAGVGGVASAGRAYASGAGTGTFSSKQGLGAYPTQ